MMTSCNVSVVSLYHNSLVMWYAVNMLFWGDKDKGTL